MDPRALAEKLAECPLATLALVDYAEPRVEQLKLLLRHLLAAKLLRPVRLLLLARDGDWWTNFGDESRVVGDLADTTPLIELEPVDFDAPKLFHQALLVLRAGEGTTETIQPEAIYSTDPLSALMAAYVYVHGDEELTTRGLIPKILAHERRYWNRHLEPSANRVPLLDGCEEVMAVITLRGGITTAELARLITETPSATELNQKEQRRVQHAISGCYARTPRRIGPLQPDLLGEALVYRVLTKHGGVDETAILALALTSAAPMQQARCLRVLVELVRRYPQLRPIIKGVVETQSPDWLVSFFVPTAIVFGDPLLTALRDVVVTRSKSDHIRDFVDAMWPPSSPSIPSILRCLNALGVSALLPPDANPSRNEQLSLNSRFWQALFVANGLVPPEAIRGTSFSVEPWTMDDAVEDPAGPDAKLKAHLRALIEALRSPE